MVKLNIDKMSNGWMIAYKPPARQELYFIHRAVFNVSQNVGNIRHSVTV